MNKQERIDFVKKYHVRTKTTKLCPKCLSEELILLRSINEKFCTECGESFAWHLDKNQKNLL